MKRFSKIRTRGFTMLLAVLVLIIVFFSNISAYIIDYQWFLELGYKEVFFKKLVTQLQFFVPALVALFLLFYLYLNSINAHSIKLSGMILTNAEKKSKNKIICFVFSGLILYSFINIRD